MVAREAAALVGIVAALVGFGLGVAAERCAGSKSLRAYRWAKPLERCAVAVWLVVVVAVFLAAEQRCPENMKGPVYVDSCELLPWQHPPGADDSLP